jgi:hypothetical protein
MSRISKRFVAGTLNTAFIDEVNEPSVARKHSQTVFYGMQILEAVSSVQTKDKD